MTMWGALAPSMLASDARLPVDLEKTTFVLSDDAAQTRLINDGRQLNVGVERQTHVKLMPPTDESVTTARIGVTDSRVSNQDDLTRLINASVWTYSFDRTTGEATSDATVSSQLASPLETVPVNGVWVKFPTDAQQTTYEVFDPLLRDAIPAVFEESLEQDGRTIYRYHQDIEPVNVAERYSSVFNTIEVSAAAQSDVSAEGDVATEEEAAAAEASSKQAYLYHSGTRDYYVDQITGLIINVEEDIDDYYGDASGAKLEQALLFDGAGSEEQTATLLDQASQVDDGRVSRIIDYVILGLGLVLVVVGLLGSFGVLGRKKHAGSAAQPE